jgi:hypothetical protein
MNQTPFNLQTPVTPPIFVSREKEIQFLKENILFNNESVVLDGLFRIGKSSTILTFLETILAGDVEQTERIFPVRIIMTQFYNSLKNDFLSTITHELVALIWTKVMGNSYSELLEDITLNPKKSKSVSKHVNRIKRIYKIVSSSSFATKGTYLTEASAKLIIAGKKTGGGEVSITRKPLQAFEFMLLLDELMEVLSDFGYGKILFFCDELNHLPPAANYELFSTYLDVFSSKKILFAMTATSDNLMPRSPEKVEMKVLVNSFSRSFSMGPFTKKEDIEQLVKNSLNHGQIENIEFDTSTFEKIFEVTEGYPWFVAKLCNTIFFEAYQNGIEVINMEMIDKYSIPFTKTLMHYKSNFGQIERRYFIESGIR